MKIGIVSEFNINTINYGNNLQAYALNVYIKRMFPNDYVDTIYTRKVRRSRRNYPIVISKRLYRIVKKIIKKQPVNIDLLQKRLIAFKNFREKTVSLVWHELNWKELVNSDYDLFIVGSDVVWAQEKYNGISRTKFLDFQNKKGARKVSYAASFGVDYIPRSYRKYICKCLKDFYMISVREKSTVSFLKSMGVLNVVHAVDPTLLLTKNEWENIENAPEIFEPKNVYRNTEPKKDMFVFAYLLGSNKKQEKELERLCRKNYLKLVTIPCANGISDQINEKVGDIQLWDCAPEEWLWLIHHAAYVITDSFHGVVFSTIFQSRFLAIKRDRTLDNRLIDYLETIRQEDKLIELKELNDLHEFKWDYSKIDQLLEEKIAFSRDYLKRTCT